MMKLTTLCIAAALLAVAASPSLLTVALAAADDVDAAPLAAAGTTPNNLTGAGAMFGNKYQGDVSGRRRGAGRKRFRR
jgi:hypothetical protein